MLHPSYSDLMKVINSEVEQGETPVVNSRYSIVLATAKRARQIISRQMKGDEYAKTISKPLSKAVSELNEGKIRVLPEEPEDVEEAAPVTEEEINTDSVE